MAIDKVIACAKYWFAAARYTPRPKLEDVLRGRDEIASACRAVGRDPAEIEITAMWHMQTGLDTVRRYRDAGIHRMLVPVVGKPAEVIEAVGEAITAL